MIRAYDKTYLDTAMENLGEMLDYAANACCMNAEEYWDLFIASGYAEQFGNGAPGVISGLSGTELVWEVIDRTGLKVELPKAQIEYDCSPEYWGGWIMAYYQWYTGQSFRDIQTYLSIRDVLKLYPVLHEASEDKFVDSVKKMFLSKRMPTRLQMKRKECGYTQKMLSEKSGVNLRTLQHYEMRGKDINRAAGNTLAALARALECRMEDLLEFDNVQTDKDI